MVNHSSGNTVPLRAGTPVHVLVCTCLFSSVDTLSVYRYVACFRDRGLDSREMKLLVMCEHHHRRHHQDVCDLPTIVGLENM